MFINLPGRALRLTIWSSLAFGLIVSAYFVNANRDWVWRQVHPFVTRQREKITELYFTDYNSLPKTPNVNSQYTVNFTIVNHEGEKRVYQYQEVITENGISREFDPQSVAVNDDQSVQLQIKFSLLQPYVHDVITINLLNTDQSIRFSAFSLK